MPRGIDAAAWPWWIAAGAALGVAVLAGFADWRRRRRVDLDRIGMLDWRTVQMVSLIVAAMLGTVATHA